MRNDVRGFEQFLQDYPDVRTVLYNLGKPRDKQVKRVTADQAIKDYRALRNKDRKYMRAYDLWLEKDIKHVPVRAKGYHSLREETDILDRRDYINSEFIGIIKKPRSYEADKMREFVRRATKGSIKDKFHSGDALDTMFYERHPEMLRILERADRKARARPTDKATVDKINARKSEYGNYRKGKKLWNDYTTKKKKEYEFFKSVGVKNADQYIALHDMIMANPYVKGDREVELQGGKVSLVERRAARSSHAPRAHVPSDYELRQKRQSQAALQLAQEKRKLQLLRIAERRLARDENLVDDRGYFTKKGLKRAGVVEDPDDLEADEDDDYRHLKWQRVEQDNNDI